ncbi:MAG: DegT/DnrJ/EryC1/StrS aminotransferase family protein [Planctomycetota bacterium]
MLAMVGQRGAGSAPPAWPEYDEESIAAVNSVLRSGQVNYWTGNQGRQFEAEFAAYCGCRHAVATANGTLALELALHSLGVGPGDEVVVPSRTFIATASSVVARGARPVCADVDRDSQTLNAATVEPQLSQRTKAVILVHLAGWPCDAAPIIDLVRGRGIGVVEDCAQAHGAEYKGRRVGSLGDVAAFSFCQDKIMSTGGEGGMLTTNRSDLWDRAWRYKDHGKTPSAYYDRQPPSSKFRWLHEGFGSNFRMTEMQAAIGRVQLTRMPEWSATRRRNLLRLAAACAETQFLRAPLPGPEACHAGYKFYCFVEPDRLPRGWDRDRLIRTLRDEGVPCFSGSCSEIYLEEAFPLSWRPAERHLVARELGETSLMIPVHPTIPEAQVQSWVDAIAALPERLSTNAHAAA